MILERVGMRVNSLCCCASPSLEVRWVGAAPCEGAVERPRAVMVDASFERQCWRAVTRQAVPGSRPLRTGPGGGASRIFLGFAPVTLRSATEYIKPAGLISKAE